MPQSFTDLIDLSLLSRFLEKLKLYFIARKTSSIPWAQVDSTSTSTAYTATVEGITELRDGVCVMLMNGVVTSESGFTININNLGAKPVYSTLAAASRATTLFNVAYTFLLVYNSHRVSGGCWDAYYGYDSNTNTIGYQLRTNSTTMPVTDKFYRYRLLFTAADRAHYAPANTSSSTNATSSRTVNQRPIDPFGPIFYYGHTTAINANANPTATYFWKQYNITLGYSFNCTNAALELTNHTPVYIKCAPQSDGSAIIDADNPYVQTLPNTADGKIYIFLGIASSATTVEIVPFHPVYYYSGGQIRLWTGVDAYEKPSGGIPASDLADGVIPDISGKQDAPLEIPVTESDGTYSTTATAAQIRAAKENSVFVFDGEARIKALLWFPWDEGVDLLIGTQFIGGTFYVVSATVTTNNVAITVQHTVIPTDTSDLTNGAGYITINDVPAAVTEQTVSGWGFTKNTGTYSKPSGGIPKTDLSAAVQTSLGKADSALQQHQSLSAYQTKAITDTGNYFTADTVEGALQEIGAELAGVNTLIGSGVIS